MRPRICILVFSQVAYDSRVLREITYASREFSVDVIGYGDWSPPQGVRYFQLPKTKRSRAWLARYTAALVMGKLVPSTYDRLFWMKKEYVAARQLLERGNYDLIHANDWDALPVAVRAAEGSGTKVLFDAHEYTPEQEADKTLWRWLVKPYRMQLFKTYLPGIHSMTTVSEGLRDLYRQHWGKDPVVVMNARPFRAFKFKAVDPDCIQLVYHGYALRMRYLEDYIQMMPHLPQNYKLNMLAVAGDAPYLESLKKMAESVAPGRVTFYGQMPSDKLVEWVSRFDIGLPSGRVLNMNTQFTLGNKFFDYVMAGLAVLVSPQPSYERLIVAHGIGLVSASPEPLDMAKALQGSSISEIDDMKKNSLKLAQILNAESELDKLMRVYHRTLELS